MFENAFPKVKKMQNFSHLLDTNKQFFFSLRHFTQTISRYGIQWKFQLFFVIFNFVSFSNYYVNYQSNSRKSEQKWANISGQR